VDVVLVVGLEGLLAVENAVVERCLCGVVC
jgi:hypothetical protein